MKKYNVIFLFFFLSISVFGQEFDYLSPDKYIFYANQSYGQFERNKFDLIVPTNAEPHGLAIYIHGGGFKFGDKKNLYKREKDIRYLLEHNIAVATINYRFYNDSDKMGVKLCLLDIQHAIQYLKHNAGKYNIDKTRVGCYGISAGAGSSLYFDFHDDLAIPNDTSLLGESTKIKCAGALMTQATYDVFAWQKFIPWLGLEIKLKKKYFYNFAANFYGYENYNSFKPYKSEITQSLDMLRMIDKNDAPVYLMNLLKETFPKDFNVIEHHKNHAKEVSKILNKNGVKNYLYTYKQAKTEAEVDYPIYVFLADNLAVK